MEPRPYLWPWLDPPLTTMQYVHTSGSVDDVMFSQIQIRPLASYSTWLARWRRGQSLLLSNCFVVSTMIFSMPFWRRVFSGASDSGFVLGLIGALQIGFDLILIDLAISCTGFDELYRYLRAKRWKMINTLYKYVANKSVSQLCQWSRPTTVAQVNFMHSLLHIIHMVTVT